MTASNAVIAVAAVLTSLGVGAILAATITGMFGRKKAAADTASIIGDAARELLLPMRERLHEMADEEKRLRRRVEDLEADLRWLRAERADQIRRDAAMQVHLRALSAWASEWLPRARAMGLEVIDPPVPPDLVPLIDPLQLVGPPSPRQSREGGSHDEPSRHR